MKFNRFNAKQEKKKVVNGDGNEGPWGSYIFEVILFEAPPIFHNAPQTCQGHVLPRP